MPGFQNMRDQGRGVAGRPIGRRCDTPEGLVMCQDGCETRHRAHHVRSTLSGPGGLLGDRTIVNDTGHALLS
jgi:hypothetical protein